MPISAPAEGKLRWSPVLLDVYSQQQLGSSHEEYTANSPSRAESWIKEKWARTRTDSLVSISKRVFFWQFWFEWEMTAVMQQVHAVKLRCNNMPHTQATFRIDYSSRSLPRSTKRNSIHGMHSDPFPLMGRSP